MIQEQFTEDIIQEAINGIDFTSLDYSSLDFVFGNFDNLQLMINQGYKSKNNAISYPLLMYILPEPSSINLENSNVVYRSQNVRLFLINSSSKDWTWSEFKTNSLNSLAELKMAFFESLNHVSKINKIETVNEYIHKWLSIRTNYTTDEDLLSATVGGYELQFDINIKKLKIC